MGISIAYKGKLRSPSLIPELIADVRARAEAAGFPYEEMPALLASGRVSCAGLTGISVYPHKDCEPVRFHFDAEGVFVNHLYQSMLEPGSPMAKALLETIADMSLLGAPAPSEGPTLVVPTLPPDFGSSPFIEKGRRYNWTKTQHAGPDVHVAVCELLRHVKERYAPDLEIKDDSGYYETGDRAALDSQLAYADRFIAATKSAFEAVTSGSSKPGEAPKTLSGLVDAVNEELANERDKLH